MSKSFRLTPPKPPKLREDDVEEACKELLAYRGYYVVRIPTGLYRTPDGRRWVRVGTKGIADYVAIHGTYPAILIETKATGKELSPEQERLSDLLRLGFRLAVAKVDNVEDLVRILDQHEAKHRKGKT